VSILVVIEAPGKLSMLASILGLEKQYLVATSGHFREHVGWKPVGITPSWDEYGLLYNEPIKDGLIARARSLNPQEVIVATDDDTEGDVIGRDVYECLRQHWDRWSSTVFTRVRLGSLDEAAVTAAFAGRTQYRDQKLTLAGDVRRIIDRVLPVCFGSPERRGAVGRVRSVALRGALTERIPVKWLEARLPVDQQWELALDAAVTDSEVTAVRGLTAGQVQVRAGEEWPRHPLPNTMDVLRASPAFAAKPSGVMGALQRLYEAGLMSYPRTRSRAVSEQSVRWAAGVTARPIALTTVSSDQKDGAHGCLTPIAETEFSRTRPLNGSNLDDAVLNWVSRRVVDHFEPRAPALDKRALPPAVGGLDWRLQPRRGGTASGELRVKPLDVESQALELLAALDVGRPSTFASHARTLAGLALFDPTGLSPTGQRLAGLVPPELMDDRLCRAVDALANSPKDHGSVADTVERLFSENLPEVVVSEMKRLLEKHGDQHSHDHGYSQLS